MALLMRGKAFKESSMKRVLLAAAGLAILSAVPASAQWGGPYGPPGRQYGPSDEEVYYERRPSRRYYRDDDFDDRRRYGPPGRRYGQAPSGGFGNICVTSRGSCPAGRPVPHNTPCGCNIPGFGYKRGAVAGSGVMRGYPY